MNNKKTIFLRVYLSFFAIALVAIGVIYQLLNIQVVHGAEWRAEADSLMTKLVDVPAKRGNIYAADGSLLSASLYEYDIHMDTRASGLLIDDIFDRKVDSLALKLAELFKGKIPKTSTDWKRTLTTARANESRYLLISKDVNHTDLKTLKTFPIFRRGQYGGGIIVEPRNERKNPYGTLAKRTLGYLRPNDSDFVVGLEGYFNPELGGRNGKILKQKISSKVWIPINDANTVEPIDGKDLHTTIDVNIQDIVESALLKGVEKHEAKNACVIVMEVKTGKILAISNLKRSSGEKAYYSEIYNYAIGVKTQPGSTFKLAPLLALLEHNYMHPDDTMSTGGKWEIYDRVLRDEKDYGTLTLQRAFEVSSNIVMGKALEEYYGHQPKKFIDFLAQLGLNQASNIPITGEPKPFIKTPDSSDWSGTTLAWMAHGYELELTPLQTLNMYNTVANGGTVMRPMLVTSISNVAKTEKEFKPQVLGKKVLSERTVRFATSIMKGVVDSGTALYYVRTPKLKIAGKTGTAVLKKTEEGKEYQSSFAGFFPAEAPKYSCIVVVQEPQAGKYYGAQVAGPIFREIAEGIHSLDISLDEAQYTEVLASLDKRPTFLKAKTQDLNKVYKALDIPVAKEKPGTLWAEPFATDKGIQIRQKTDDPNLIPDVKGLSLSDAFYICENAGLKIVYDGSGTVFRQVPEKKTPYVTGKTIYLNLR